MSCKNFETIITEMARGQLLDAGARESMLEHVQGCQLCAARLADERMLTAGLRNLASMSEAASATSRVEKALVSAFRRRGETPFVPAAVPAARTLSHGSMLGIAAAAALLVVSAFAASRLLFIDSGGTLQQSANVSNPEPTSSPAVARKEPETPSPDYSGDPDQDPSITPSASPRFYDRQRELVKDVRLPNKPIRNAIDYPNGANTDREITTEFLPLTYGGLSQVDDGQMVRVELPRSALQSLGLPVNVERAGGRVKADVLLGHDGVARAIRFVR